MIVFDTGTSLACTWRVPKSNSMSNKYNPLKSFASGRFPKETFGNFQKETLGEIQNSDMHFSRKLENAHWLVWNTIDLIEKRAARAKIYHIWPLHDQTFYKGLALRENLIFLWKYFFRFVRSVRPIKLVASQFTPFYQSAHKYPISPSKIRWTDTIQLLRLKSQLSNPNP